ncbi:DNA cytosine methyltransferase [Serratia fonticola]|uniref:DNA cytosine methyltransferase n=1 Tax=Serratia fonticola TaxID=47917 RepID=UPI00192AA26F|nr:DNA cytosine methyltransferase [Serratia fonticola]MBL5862089.1 DNA cytosine methyltransferase [Serratia fonticola]
MTTLSPSITYGSICSGIEAVSLAWQPLGLQAAWFAEIDAFPCAVLAHHYPQIPNLGDMTLIAPQVLCGAVAAPDILVGGTPCQSFSIAGMRQGITDPRGALTLKYVELANAIDQTRITQEKPPAVIVWENVPGIFSDKHNAFGHFLGALSGENHALLPSGQKWTHSGCVYGPQRAIAWRTLDAQYFGVAQRRKRVFLVASADHRIDPAEVLFEFDSLRRDTPPDRQATSLPPCTALSGSGSAGSNASSPASPCPADWSVTCYGGGNTQGPIDKAACLTARGFKCDFDVETFAVQTFGHTQSPVRTDYQALAMAENCRNELRLYGGEGNIAGALMTSGGKPGQGTPVVAELSPTLRASNGAGDLGHIVLPSYEAHFHYSPDLSQEQPAYGPRWLIRRLMPVECERLQGMPDNYSLVPYRGKPATDSPRYKAIGNSMAVPCVAWLGQRLLQVLAKA